MLYEAKRWLTKEDVKYLKYCYDYRESFKIRKLRNVSGVYSIEFEYESHIELQMFFEDMNLDGASQEAWKVIDKNEGEV